MSERRCEGCRWFRCDIEYEGKQHGVCRRNPPVNGEFSEVHGDSMCGEWADKTITPEQAERSELVRQFALAIAQGVCSNPEGIDLNVMLQAQLFADDFHETMKEGISSE